MLVTSKLRALLPRVIERRDIIVNVLERYRQQYTDPTMKLAGGKTAGETAQGLASLDLQTATVTDVAAVIGNDSWTALTCNVCEEDRDRVVSVPREYEGPLYICGDCAAGVTELLAANDSGSAVA
jgi:hypothetical protein